MIGDVCLLHQAHNRRGASAVHIEANRALSIVDRHEVYLQDNKAVIDSRVVYHAHRVQQEPVPMNWSRRVARYAKVQGSVATAPLRRNRI